MLVASGTILVLATWIVAVVAVASVGLLPALVVERSRVTWRTVARAPWWGLLGVALIAASMAVALPLRSSLVVGSLTLLVALSVMAGWVIIRRRGWAGGQTRTAGIVVVAATLTLVSFTFAAAALGPVTNYDAGLYHLGAIRYAMEFPTIPGLSNLYGPLGYGNAGFPLAALLGNGPLGLEGYRTLNGFVFVLALLDLSIRALQRRWSAGTYVLLVGVAVSVPPMLWMADFWVTSPSQDSAVLMVTVVASAYLVDALAGRRTWVPDGAAAMALATLLVLLRPTMVVFAVAVVIVLALQGWRARARTSPGHVRAGAFVVLIAGALAVAATLVRDYLLSGWLLYPLSILPFDVEWRASDPTGLREATLGFWRNRNDIWGSVDGWAWVAPWFSTLPSTWEARLLGLLLVASGVGLVVARIVGTLRWRRLALAMTPSVAASAAWWLVTPPGFRFGWGPLFTLLTIPLGWALWRFASCRPGWQGAVRVLPSAGVALLLAVTATMTILSRIDLAAFTTEGSWDVGSVSVSFSYAPVPEPPTTTFTTDSGLVIRVPVKTDQCWSVFPLCTPRPESTLQERGDGIAEGFLP